MLHIKRVLADFSFMSMFFSCQLDYMSIRNKHLIVAFTMNALYSQQKYAILSFQNTLAFFLFL